MKTANFPPPFLFLFLPWAKKEKHSNKCCLFRKKSKSRVMWTSQSYLWITCKATPFCSVKTNNCCGKGKLYFSNILLHEMVFLQTLLTLAKKRILIIHIPFYLTVPLSPSFLVHSIQFSANRNRIHAQVETDMENPIVEITKLIYCADRDIKERFVYFFKV